MTHNFHVKKQSSASLIRLKTKMFPFLFQFTHSVCISSFSKRNVLFYALVLLRKSILQIGSLASIRCLAFPILRFTCFPHYSDECPWIPTTQGIGFFIHILPSYASLDIATCCSWKTTKNDIECMGTAN